MKNDFRALCAELLNVFDSYDDQSNLAGILDEMKANKIDLLERARAALADEPAVPEGREPAAVTGQPSDAKGPEDADLHAMAFSYSQPCYQFEYIPYARAVLARWGTSNLAETRRSLGDGEVAERAAELLQRQAQVPVPVSERPPGPGDCLPWPGEPDETHWCWAFMKGPLDDDSWERRPVTCLTTYKPMHSHWLPAHALPLPLPEVGE